MNSISGAAPHALGQKIYHYRYTDSNQGAWVKKIEELKRRQEEKALKESLREGGVIFKVLSASLV